MGDKLVDDDHIMVIYRTSSMVWCVFTNLSVADLPGLTVNDTGRGLHLRSVEGETIGFQFLGPLCA